MFKHYNLTGQTVKVKRKTQKATDEEPWAYTEQKMKIVAEYPTFLRAVVLPHMNPKGFDVSHPYMTCLHKHDIECGDIIMNGGAIR